MQRRTLLRLGIASAAVLAIAGTGASWLRPGWSDGRLTRPGRDVFAATARAVLDGILPTEPTAQQRALAAHLDRLDAAIAAFPAPTRDEISLLLALLASPPGRRGLAGLATPWADAAVDDIQQALQSMRTSTVSLRMQAYHALRDLTNAAWFADPLTWDALGYPGPRPL